LLLSCFNDHYYFFLHIEGGKINEEVDGKEAKERKKISSYDGLCF
jgi:hypothetical protein